MKKLGYKKRSYTKSQCLGNPENRDRQFRRIAQAKERFLNLGLPVLSIDTKKKEMLGNFGRGGKFYGKEKRRVNDHDFLTFAKGVVVPHGIYDVGGNTGYITLGVSKDTSGFVCDNIRSCWQGSLGQKYPNADYMLLLCDGGGSNSCRHYIVKQDLAKLASDLGINILVAHYPAYCSKWNPIEHKLFCHVHRAFDGAVFDSLETVKDLALKTSTKTGLRVEVQINPNTYETGRKYDPEFKTAIEKQLFFDEELPLWNYLVFCDKVS